MSFLEIAGTIDDPYLKFRKLVTKFQRSGRPAVSSSAIAPEMNVQEIARVCDDVGGETAQRLLAEGASDLCTPSGAYFNLAVVQVSAPRLQDYILKHSFGSNVWLPHVGGGVAFLFQSELRANLSIYDEIFPRDYVWKMIDGVYRARRSLMLKVCRKRFKLEAPVQRLEMISVWDEPVLIYDGEPFPFPQPESLVGFDVDALNLKWLPVLRLDWLFPSGIRMTTF